MKRNLTVIAALACGALALPAAAQSMKPGLWEVTNNISSPDGKLQSAMNELHQAMAAMDPEQRKRMEEMMAKQGVQFGGVAGGGMLAKMCITPEMSKRSELPMQQQGECTHTRSKATAGKMTFTFSCKNPRSSGEGEVTFAGDTAYKMKMKVLSGGEQADVILMDASGKWQGADCGNIKPFALPKAK